MPKARPSTDTPMPSDGASTLSYEAAMQELELLVSNLESGELPLEQLMSGYQRGAALLQLCRDKLQAVEDQIKVLDDGVLKPWKPQ